MMPRRGCPLTRWFSQKCTMLLLWRGEKAVGKQVDQRTQATNCCPVIPLMHFMYSSSFLKGCAAGVVTAEQSGACHFLFFFSPSGRSASQAPSVVRSQASTLST